MGSAHLPESWCQGWVGLKNAVSLYQAPPGFCYYVTLPDQELHKQVPCRRGDLQAHAEGGAVPGCGSQAWTHPALLRAAGTNANSALRSGSSTTYPPPHCHPHEQVAS